MMTLLTWLVQQLGRLEKALGITLILAITAMIMAQVITRYFLDLPLAWVEELATYAFIWAVFLGASCALRDRRHIAIEAFHLLLTHRQRQWLTLMIWISILVFLVVLIPQTFKVMGVESRSNTVSLPIDLPRMWFYSVPLGVSCCSMLLTTMLGLIENLQRLCLMSKESIS